MSEKLTYKQKVLKQKQETCYGISVERLKDQLCNLIDKYYEVLKLDDATEETALKMCCLLQRDILNMLKDDAVVAMKDTSSVDVFKRLNSIE